MPDLIVAVGGASQTADYPAAAAGSLAEFGIPVATGHGPPVLPLSLTVGAWLIRTLPAARPSWRLELQAIGWSASPSECMMLGAQPAGRADRVALLVMGDGSAGKVLGASGGTDPGAERYDQIVKSALATADAASLAALDAGAAAGYLAAGRPAWQVLAGAALAGEPGAADGRRPDGRHQNGRHADERQQHERLPAGPQRNETMPGQVPRRPAGRLTAQLSYAAAPLDVMYFVASWTSQPPGGLA